MRREIIKFTKALVIIGIAISLALLSTGLMSPPNIFGESIRKNIPTHMSIFHSGPYKVIIQINKNWSMKIWFSEHIDGKYKLIWSGNGSYPEIVHIFIPSRGYLKIWTNQSGGIYLQRIRPSFQYDYFYQGLYLFIIFSLIYIGIFIYEKKTVEDENGKCNDKTS